MSIEKVKEYFRQYGMEDRVWEKEHSSATVEERSDWSWKRENCVAIPRQIG